MKASELARKGSNTQIGDEAHQPNPKNPWTRKLSKTKSTALWRLKQALRAAGLNHSFFTKTRTPARRKNYREALSGLKNSELKAQCVAVWGKA